MMIFLHSRLQLHLEAAHVLKYAEEEFLNLLDWQPFVPGKYNAENDNNGNKNQNKEKI